MDDQDEVKGFLPGTCFRHGNKSHVGDFGLVISGDFVMLFTYNYMGSYPRARYVFSVPSDAEICTIDDMPTQMQNSVRQLARQFSLSL